MNIYDTLVQIAAALKKHDVRYMIVGGLAVGYHGYFRQTMARNGEYVDKPTKSETNRIDQHTHGDGDQYKTGEKWT